MISNNQKPKEATSNFNNRHTDVAIAAVPVIKTPLPSIDWQSIGETAPVKIPIGDRQPNDPLPYADWVILTWTSAEWEAIDHVFLNSTTPAINYEWRKEWHQYSRGAQAYPADPQSGLLWGQFQMVQITDQSKRPWRVLLFKSNSHLAHSPWLDGLSAMMKCILADTKADRIYTIGTAGGARLDQSLGDAIIANSSVLELQRPQNSKDTSNGNSFRCPTWFPATSMISSVQEKLLLKINTVATRSKLEELFNELKSKHPNDSAVNALQLDDLLNQGLNPESPDAPKIQVLKDAPLLTTDFYYIANGNSADAFAFLEMDDAIIAKEANALGVRFACIRNISDPIVPDKTKTGAVISDGVRGDWSGLIYTNFGLYTSFNGALATWATIAGEGSALYNPKRFTAAPAADDPIEIKLAYEVTSCGTCNFFWPEDKQTAGYGPYTAFTFDVNVPYQAARPQNAFTAPWVLGRTRPPAFPAGEIIDGCRKAPIMTIGINPNLTAFAPGQNGAAWAYPDFSSDDNTNAWAKYAWYYRYRSVYQEKVSLDFVKKFILPEGQIIAQRDGKVISAARPDRNPAWSVNIRYNGDPEDSVIAIPGVQGDFPYMLFFDTSGPNNSFSAGDIIAGKVAVPQGIQVEIEQEQQTYYMQFLPTLNKFQSYLNEKGHSTAKLQIGEDVSQLDMVACASPHWTEGFLNNEMKTVVHNCVSNNAWAIKQLVQSKPAILYIVSESSWNMFYYAFGNFVDKDRISPHPVDQSFTLLRETTDLSKPVYINFDFDIDGLPYKSKTRLVITPHFSFNTNFFPQYRLSPADFSTVAAMPDFQNAITAENGFLILAADIDNPENYREIQLLPDTFEATRQNLKNTFPELFARLERYYYNAHELMASVMNDMYDKGELSYDDLHNYLKRTDGGCKFCANQYWQFPNECRYGKPAEQSPPPGYLEKAAAYIASHGAPVSASKHITPQTIQYA
jgi:nucleoside phosphorylase